MTSLAAALLLLMVAQVPRPVVVSTDCGAEVDDQWALAHLALSPRVALKGVVTTHSPNLKAPAAAKVAREVFARMMVAEPPPVVAGSSEPLGRDGKPREGPGVRFLIDAAKGHSGDDRLTVVMIGAATDVASALLIDPTWADRVQIVAMAFEGWPEGGDPWNVKNDVRAWQVVMDSRVPLVVGDAKITRKRLIQTADSAQRFAAKGLRRVPGRPARSVRSPRAEDGRIGLGPSRRVADLGRSGRRLPAGHDRARGSAPPFATRRSHARPRAHERADHLDHRDRRRSGVGRSGGEARGSVTRIVILSP